MGRTIGAVADEARDIILLLDARGSLRDVNRAAVGAYGYSYDELLRLDIRDLRASSTRGDVEEQIAKVDAAGVQFETRHQRRDGSEFDCEVSSRRLELDGEIFLVSVVRDLTERKRAEELIREKETLLWKVFHSSPVVVSITDLETNRYVDVNDSYLRVMELKRGEVVGKSRDDVGIILDPEELRRLRQAVLNKFRGEFELRIRTRGGRTLDTIHSLEFIELSGKPCVVAFAHDMTEYKRLEHQLQHAQKMDAVGRLAGGVAHDFNNILTAVRGHSEVLMGLLETGSPHRRHAEQIHRAALRAAALTSQLLAFSRKQVLQPRSIDVNSLVANLTVMLRRLIGEHVDLQTELGADLGVVRADAGQLEQVLVNLAVNARDAMPQGGMLLVATENADIDAAESMRRSVPIGRWILITVTDTGVGIDEATRARIFEPFFTTKASGKGTGLGLSTVYGIVAQSGGHIQLDSVVGQGTTFRVFLPRVGATVSTRHPTIEDVAGPSGTETVLLVEDDNDVREFVHDVLTTHGYQVLSAVDGPQALQLIEAHDEPIALLVTDVIMPRMMGSEVAARVTALRPAIKVLYISGYPGDAIARQGVLPAEHAFVQKPFSVVALARRVRALLDGRLDKDD
ncbi:MAG: Blue-light-activated protein [Myxococcales bacterium]|nr:Blue-light-activated protein [Myxococcales bacterium]